MSDIEIDIFFIYETDDAILVTDDEDDEERKIWLPKSQIEYDIEVQQYGTIVIPEWLAIEKELI